MTDTMFEEWWTNAKLNQLETKKPDLWEEVSECMDDIKVFVMDNLQASTTRDDIGSFAEDIGLTGLWKSRFVKACVSLQTSRTPSSDASETTSGSETYKIQSDIAIASLNTDTDSVPDNEAEGLMNEAQDIPSQEGAAATDSDEKGNGDHIDHDKVDTKISFGVQVDAETKWLNNDEKEESVKHAYPDVDVENMTVEQLKAKMSEYMFSPDIEYYEIYTDANRTAEASDTDKIAAIASKDENNKMYTIFAKKVFKSDKADQSKVDALAKKMVVSSTVLQGLVSALDHVDEQINCYVSDLEEIFGKFEDDPTLKTLLSICRFKGQTKENSDLQTKRQIELAQQNVQDEEGPDALTQMIQFGDMAGTCLDMVGGVCSLYSYKQDKKINKWTAVKKKDKKEYKAWQKKNKGTSPKRKAYRAKKMASNKAAANKKIATAKKKKRRMAGGIAALGSAMQAAELGMKIYQMVDAANKRAEALQVLADELSQQINVCANSFESSALIYDNLVTVLWNLKEMLYMAFKKELDEKNVFAAFMEPSSKPTMAKFRNHITSQESAGKPQALFDLKNAVAAATRIVISYLRDLSERYVEMRTRLDSRKYDVMQDIEGLEKEIEAEADDEEKEFLQRRIKKKMKVIDGQSLRTMFDSFLDYKQKMSDEDDLLQRGTQNDLLELYYNAFLVYTFKTGGTTEGSPYGKYNIDPKIDMENAVLEILDKDNLLKNDLLCSEFFNPKEFCIEKYIAEDLQSLQHTMQTLAFVRVARARYMIFSGYKSRNDETMADSDANKAKKLGKVMSKSDDFEKYSFTLLLFLMKVYKKNPVASIKYM